MVPELCVTELENWVTDNSLIGRVLVLFARSPGFKPHCTGCCDIHLYSWEMDVGRLRVLPDTKLFQNSLGYWKPASEEWLKTRNENGERRNKSFFQSMSQGIQ